MIKHIALAALLAAIVAAPAMAQTIPQKQVEIRWSVDGAEPDVQQYQLYVSSTGDPGSFGPAGDPIPFNPLAPDNPAMLSTDYTFSAPAGEVTARWFTVTATDTSGNESQPATPVKVEVDNKPPAPPTGLTITVVIIPTQ